MLNTKRNIKKALTTCLLAITPLLSMHANATVYTATSPSLLDVTAQPFGAAAVGGIIIDLVGLNGSRIVSQIGTSTMNTTINSSTTTGINTGYRFSESSVDIATQSGFSNSLLNTLGGGLSSAHFRFSIFGGDTGPGDSHEDKIIMLVNGTSLGNWSDITPQGTDSNGVLNTHGISAGGFRAGVDDTGWFSLSNAGSLQTLYNSISKDGSVTLSFEDSDPGNHYLNFYEFGTNTIEPLAIAAVPEPETYGMFLVGLGLICFVQLKKKY